MDKILRVLFNIKDLKRGDDDDFSDRLTRTYTTSMLLLFCVIVTSSHYVGNVIHCWAPAEFTDSHKQYTNTMCWISDTYYVPMDRQTPLSLDAEAQRVNYYQWVPFILLGQALLCLVPRLVWKFLCSRAGVSISSFVSTAVSVQNSAYSDMRDKTHRFVAFQLDHYLRARQAKARLFSRPVGGCRKAFSNLYKSYRCSYLTMSYMCSKFLYMANAIAQLYMLDVFLGMDFHMYGVVVLRRLFSGVPWMEEGRFPTVTLCEFQVRRQTQNHKYIVQCALPINLFNSRLFLCIWFWFVILGLISAASAITWILRLSFPSARSSYLRKQLALNHPLAARKNKRQVALFSEKYLRTDGVLICRLISQNAGCLAVAEVVGALWEVYGPDYKYTVDHRISANNGSSMMEATGPFKEEV